jgi:DNA-binding GntR family transcriptional regulator
LVPTSPLALKITDDIEALIESGRIQIGGHLIAQKLADPFGISRSPVREAMHMLANEGLLELRANRGQATASA